MISIREQAGSSRPGSAELGRRQVPPADRGRRGNYEIVASFLALLELYREDVVVFEQILPLGELYVTWTGGDRAVVLAPPGAGSVDEATESEDEDYT